MAVNRTLSLAIVASGLLCAPSLAQTSTPPANHAPLAKTIGEAETQIVPSLIVINSRGAVLQDGKLTLTGVMPSSIVFADRPVRAAGHTPTAHLVKEWSPEQTFADDPPNATISVFAKDGGAVRDAVVVLKSAALDADRLTFDVDVLEGALTGGDGAAALFIDRFGFGGFHAGGFRAGGFAMRGGDFRGGYARVGYGHVGGVGVWHRPYVAGGAWYRGAGYGVGAAAVGAAALGAAAAAPYYNGACGYYPNPPC
jgi:hypothetical protein